MESNHSGQREKQPSTSGQTASKQATSQPSSSIRVAAVWQYLLRVTIALFLLGLIMAAQSCRNFYKVEQIIEPEPKDLQTMIEGGKYLIVHQGFTAYNLIKPRLRNDTLRGQIVPLPPDRWNFLATNVEGYTSYKYKDQRVLQERHFYLRDSVYAEVDSAIVAIPLSAIHHMDIYKHAPGRSTYSWVSAIVYPVVVVAGILILTSCPIIYTGGSDGYILTGEIYGGAIFPALERDDYLQLPEAAVFKDKAKLKIANELKECQHTNLAELLVVSHPPQSKAYIDKYGNIVTTSHELTPVSAITAGGNNFTKSVIEKDFNSFMFNESSGNNSVNELNLTFEIPEYAQNLGTAKLIVTAKNSLWADFAYNEFYTLMGNYYPTWVEKQRELDREELTQQMLDQDTPLSVHLLTNNGWKFMDFYNVTGPLAARDLAMQLDLTEALVSQSRTIQLKIVSGFMFWEVDYAALDFSVNQPVSSIMISAESAMDENGKDVLSTLNRDDHNYLIQPDIGNVTHVSFDLSGLNAGTEKRTFFLHSKGYYEKNPEYTGDPAWFKLMSLKRRHSFTDFSFNLYKEYTKEMQANASSKLQAPSSKLQAPSSK